jgi:F0F1-type ATP synthase membrane subunit b/b'
MPEPIHPAEAKEIQENYLQFLDNTSEGLNKFKKHIEAKFKDWLNQNPDQKSKFKDALSSESSLEIYVGKEKIYEKLPGEEPTIKENIEPYIESIKQAFIDPQKLNGSVRIYVGDEKLFHVKNGKVLTDKLGLVQNQTQTQTKFSTPSIEEQLTALTKTVEQQSHKIEFLENRLATIEQTLDKLTSSLVPFQVHNPKLQNFLNKTNNSIGTALTSLKQKVKTFFSNISSNVSQKAQEYQTQAATTVKNTVNTVRTQGETVAYEVSQKAQEYQTQAASTVKNTVNNVRDKVETTVDNTVSSVKKAIADFNGILVSTAVEKLLYSLGTLNSDRSITFEGNKYSFRQDMVAGNVTITAKTSGKTIFKDGELTNAASQEDIQALKQFPEDIIKNLDRDESLNQSQSQSQSQSRSRSRSR